MNAVLSQFSQLYTRRLCDIYGVSEDEVTNNYPDIALKRSQWTRRNFERVQEKGLRIPTELACFLSTFAFERLEQAAIPLNLVFTPTASVKEFWWQNGDLPFSNLIALASDVLMDGKVCVDVDSVLDDPPIVLVPHGGPSPRERMRPVAGSLTAFFSAIVAVMDAQPQNLDTVVSTAAGKTEHTVVEQIREWWHRRL